MQLPPIFAQTPESIVAATTIAEFPVNTFLENIAVDLQGNLWITNHSEGKLYRVTPEGNVQTVTQIDGNLAGIVSHPEGYFLVAGAIEGTMQAVFQISQDGKTETLLTLPDALFLNGMTPLTGSRYLIADSLRGAIWEVDAIAKSYKLWLQHENLALLDANSFPAANGLKIYADMLYVSNTRKLLLVQIPIIENGNPGVPKIFLSNVNLDDFAFDVEGNLYATTHLYNSVVKISPQGQVTTIATAQQGMTGSTAAAFGRTETDRTCLYVTTNGGISLPPESGVEPGKVVCLEVGQVGLTMGEI